MHTRTERAQPSARIWWLFASMAVAAVLAMALQPRKSLADTRAPVVLESLVPRSFGNWSEARDAVTQIIDPQIQETLDYTYSQTLTRTYVNTAGYRIMLSLVYGKTQRGDLQLHHPEICYPAQGFELLSTRNTAIASGFGAIPGRQLETRMSASRIEPITYWSKVGDEVVQGSAARKWTEMRLGLRGYTADGLLFRISSIDSNTARAFERQGQFVQELMTTLDASQRKSLAAL